MKLYFSVGTLVNEFTNNNSVCRKLYHKDITGKLFIMLVRKSW